jgi:hypothetical protein
VLWCLMRSVATATTWPTCVTRNASGAGRWWNTFPCCRWVGLYNICVCVLWCGVVCCLVVNGVLCDEERFRNWPVVEHIPLLQVGIAVYCAV